MLARVKPFNEIVHRVNLDKCPPNEIMRIVVFRPSHSSQLLLVEIQHCVVETLRISQNSSSTANQVKMTFRHGELELQVKQIFARPAEGARRNHLKLTELIWRRVRYPKYFSLPIWRTSITGEIKSSATRGEFWARKFCSEFFKQLLPWRICRRGGE